MAGYVFFFIAYRLFLATSLDLYFVIKPLESVLYLNTYIKGNRFLGVRSSRTSIMLKVFILVRLIFSFL